MMWEEKVLRAMAIFFGILFAVSLAMLLIPAIRWPVTGALFFLIPVVGSAGIMLSAGVGAYELRKKLKKTKEKESSLGR